MQDGLSLTNFQGYQISGAIIANKFTTSATEGTGGIRSGNDESEILAPDSLLCFLRPRLY